MMTGPRPTKQPRCLPDDTEWGTLTQDLHKPATYIGDGNFRQSWSDLKNLATRTSSAIYNYTSLLLKPEALASRKSGLILDRVRKSGFRPIYAKEVQFDDKSIQAAWRYQMDRSSDDRLRLRGCFWGETAAVYIVLSGVRSDECAADMLARLKGSAHPEQQIPGTLRHGLGAPNAVFSFLHTPDDTADFIREMSIWLNYSERYDVIRAIDATKFEAQDAVLTAIAKIESSMPAASLDTKKALSDLIEMVRSRDVAAPDACRQMLDIVESSASRAAPLDLFVFEQLARCLQLPTHSWSICLFASEFIQLSAPPTRPSPFGSVCNSCHPAMVARESVRSNDAVINPSNRLWDIALVGQNLEETRESWRIQIQNARQQYAIESNVPESLERESLNRFAHRMASRCPATADTLVVCVTGPGAAGKDTILRHLGAIVPGFRRLIHVSTRAARSNPTAGDEYEFVSEEEFSALEQRRELFAVRNIAGRGRYGIRRSAVLPVSPRYLIKESARGMEQLVAEITTVTKKVEHLLIYVCPPEPIFDTLLNRAHSRAIQGNEKESVFYNTLRPFNSILFADIVARIFRDENVVVVVNDSLQRALSTIENAIYRMCSYADMPT